MTDPFMLGEALAIDILRHEIRRRGMTRESLQGRFDGSTLRPYNLTPPRKARLYHTGDIVIS